MRRALVIIAAALLWDARAEAKLIVGRIVVEGDPKTAPSVLANRMDLHEGDSLDFEKIAAAEQRLNESGLFGKARVFLHLTTKDAAQKMYIDPGEEKVDLHVEVTEKQSWFILPTASFGSDDIAGGLAYGDQNLFGHDLVLVAAGQIGQVRSFAYLTFRDPLVNKAPLTWGIEALLRYDDIRFYQNHHIVLTVPTRVYGASGEAGWVASSHVRFLAGFSARDQKVDAAEVNDASATPTPYNAQQGKIFLLSLRVVYDDTTAPEGIREGVRIILKNELSDRYWGSDFDYTKFDYRAELFGHWGWNHPSLSLNAIIDYPTSTRGVPITEMVRIGGPNLRGYATNEFHGDTLLSLQVEDQVVLLRNLPLPFVKARWNFAGAVFVDTAALLERHPGGTSTENQGQVRPDLGDFHTSLGAGVRFILPGVVIPAIKVDVGYGIDVSSFGVTVSIAGGGN